MRGRTTRWSGAAFLLCWGWIATVGAGNVSAQGLNFTPVASIPGPAEIVKVQGGYAYIATGGTLTIFDISDPAAPKSLGAYTFPDQIWGFRIVSSLVYVAADVSGLGILDVSNARAPALRGSLKTRGQAKGVAVAGTRAVVADHVSGLDIVDVSDPAKPVQVDSVFLEGYAAAVVTSGSLAYAADMPTGFSVLDLSKPGSLEPVSMLQSATVSTHRAQVEVLQASPQGPELVVLLSPGLLQMYDVSNPAAPVKIPPYRLPGGARRVSLKGKLAYVADGQEGLKVLDLSNPSNPSIVGAYKTASPARDVAVADSLVLLVVGNGEVLVLRQIP